MKRIAVTARVFAIASWVISAPIMSNKMRIRAFRALGVDVEHGAIRPGCVIQRRNVHFKGDVWLNHGVWFEGDADIWIGRGSMVGPGTRFITATHAIGTHTQRASTPKVADIHVGAGVFIGANVVVLPGVNIGDGCVIAAGAVVTKSCSPDGLYGGVPARRLRDLD